VVLAVLAHPGDPASAALVDRWRDHDARLLTSSDLSRRGWAAGSVASHRAQIVCNDAQVPESAVGGVLVRVASILPGELRQVAAADRAYCAAEMTAFLRWWLTRLPVPVVNRPSAVSLAGSGWRPAAWAVAARRLGVPPATTRWRASEWTPYAPAAAPEVPPGRTTVVTVVSGRPVEPVGPVDQRLSEHASQLARAAQMTALAVAYLTGSGGPRFLWASPAVDIGRPAVSDALLDALLRRGSRYGGAPA
jgi:hypothetical protein